MMFKRYKKLIGVCLTGIVMLGFGIAFAFGFAQETSADWTNGKFDAAMDFNGTSDFIFAGDTGENVKTVLFWIKADSIADAKIIDLDAGTNYIKVLSGTLSAQGFTSPTIYVDGVAGTTIDTNWHFVAITTDTAIDANSVYLGRVFITPANYYFNGALDDVKFYDRALLPREVAEHYRQGAPSLAQGGTISANSANTALTVIQSSTGDILNVLDNGTEVFTILDGGNVGIGDTAPSAKLSVVQSGTGKIIQAQGNRNLSYEMALYSEGELELRNTLYSDMKFIDIAGFWDGSTWATTTDEINSYGGTAQTLLADTSDFFYWGCTSTDGFSRLYFDLNAIADEDLTLDWEYSTGAQTWSNLQGTTTTDDTARTFTTDGNIDWTIPGDWATTTSFGGIATSTDSHYLVRVSTDTANGWSAPTAYYAALSRFGSDFARFTTDGADKFRIDKDGDIYVAGKIGVATVNASTTAHIISTSEQLRLGHDTAKYAQFFTDAAGDLRLTATGDDIEMADDNLLICTDGTIDSSGCPSVTLTGKGNLQVEANIYAQDIYAVNYQQMPDYQTAKDTYNPCPLGYIQVPGNPKYNTSDFCVMKYEAKKCTGDYSATTTDCSGTGETKIDDASGDPANVLDRATSYPESMPWRSIQQDSDSAQEACSNMGSGFHLITNAEWMTIADNIIHTRINDLDKDDEDVLFQLATGHTDNASSLESTPTRGLNASTTAADPVVSSCNLNLSLEETANAYTATCQLRGTGSNATSTDAKGFVLTNQHWANIYTSGGSNDSQLRTHVLSNGAVIWDFAGNVWEWNSDTMDSAHAIESSNAAGWVGYFAADSATDYLSNAQGFNVIPNISTSYTANNHGIGRIYIDAGVASDDGPTHAFLRGGYWSDGAYAGVFTLGLYNAPSYTDHYIGFRCAR